MAAGFIRRSIRIHIHSPKKLEERKNKLNEKLNNIGKPKM